MQRKTPLRSYTGLKSYTSLKSKAGIGTKKTKSSSPKKKQPSISTLKKKLWNVFSQYIRQRDNYTCFTCGRKGEGSGMHAGHFVPKSVGGIALYFHEENVNAQCYNCNINLSGNQYEYSLRLGEKAKELYALKGVTTKWTVENYIDKIEHYTQKLKDYE